MSKNTVKDKSDNWGGKRKGAGRKITGDKRVIDTTKVIRVSLQDYERLKAGKYEELMTLLSEYQTRLKTTKGAKSSPRWQQLRNLINDVEEIFGKELL